MNALKQAFPVERSGKILVDYHSHEANWTLSVSDNGVGTPESLADARPGLGTSIVEALANQLEATVETEGGYPGTTVSVTHSAVLTYLSAITAGSISKDRGHRSDERRVGEVLGSTCCFWWSLCHLQKHKREH